MSKAPIASILALLCAGAALAGCQRFQPTKTAAVAPPPPPIVSAPFSVNEMMVMIVDRPGEQLWDVEKEGHTPTTAEDWYELESHAVDLASAATLIKLGGTGPKDMTWVREPSWQAAAQRLINGALEARQAAHARDKWALITANGEIVDACEACHKQFKPDIPTGGLFIHQRPVGVPERK